MSPTLINASAVEELASFPHSRVQIARRAHEPNLFRLAQMVAELDPKLAKSLCESGLASLKDGAERSEWQERLAPFLAEDDGPWLAA